MKLYTYSEENLKNMVPALFSEKPSDKVSDVYQFVSLLPLVRALKAANWHVFSARQQGRGETGKHLIKLIQGTPNEYGHIELENEEAFTLALYGSHDASAALKGIGGILVRACLNGLLCSENTLGSFRFTHHKWNAENITEALAYFKGNFNMVQGKIEAMKTKEISEADVFNFGIRAITTRWGETNRAPKTVNAVSITTPYRFSDTGNSVWKVYNRIQENVMMHRIRDVKAIRSVSEDVRINQALWDIAVSYL